MKVLVLYEEALLSTAQMDGGVYSLAMLSALNCGLYQQVPRIADRARKEGISLTEASCMYYLLYTGVLVLSCFMWSGALDRQLWYSSIIFYSITSIAYNQPPYWYLICPLLNKSYQIYLPMYVRTYSKSRQTNSSNRTSWSHAARGRWTKHGSIDVSYK